MTILLLGSNGQVGTELKKILDPFGNLKAFNRDQLNLQDLDTLRKVVLNMGPSTIINAAAYTQVDKAESESELAHQINGTAVKVLAECAKSLNATLIHYSTDYVFDGMKEDPYIESDITNPINVYGHSKRMGEEAILESGCHHLIFRTSWVYGQNGHNFIKTILRLAQEKDKLTVINDQVGTPTSASLIAKVTVDILKAGHKPNGIYHLTPTGETTWFDYADSILTCSKEAGFNFPVELIPILTKDYPTPAKRPPNSRLKTTKISTTFGLSLPEWKDDVFQTVNTLIRQVKP